MLVHEDKQCEEIFENFDWNKVHKVMVCVDWRWGWNNQIPTILEMQEKAKELLKTSFERCEKNGKYTTGTGGFDATVVSEDGFKTAELKFVLTQWETHYYGEKWD